MAPSACRRLCSGPWRGAMPAAPSSALWRSFDVTCGHRAARGRPSRKLDGPATFSSSSLPSASSAVSLSIRLPAVAKTRISEVLIVADGLGGGGPHVVKLSKNLFLESDFCEERLPPFCREYTTLLALQERAEHAHPHIRQCVGWGYELVDASEGTIRPFGVLQDVGSGSTDLARWCRQQGGTVGPTAVAHVLRALLGAVAHLHALGYAHRDIKPANVLVCADADADSTPGGAPCAQLARVQLADFGECVALGETYEAGFTLLYADPEERAAHHRERAALEASLSLNTPLLGGGLVGGGLSGGDAGAATRVARLLNEVPPAPAADAAGGGGKSEASAALDVWQAGAVAWEMFTGGTPDSAEDPWLMRDGAARAQLLACLERHADPTCTEHWLSFFEAVFQPRNRRATAAEMLEHPALRG